jgi:citronellol/citronellal dehydrogenase
MSLCMIGLADELADHGVACNGLWPRSVIATAAASFAMGGDEALARSRKPEIMADAAHAILTRPSRQCSGRLMIDTDVLREEGVLDLSSYQVVPGQRLMPDLFVEHAGE